MGMLGGTRVWDLCPRLSLLCLLIRRVREAAMTSLMDLTLLLAQREPVLIEAHMWVSEASWGFSDLSPDPPHGQGPSVLYSPGQVLYSIPNPPTLCQDLLWSGLFGSQLLRVWLCWPLNSGFYSWDSCQDGLPSFDPAPVSPNLFCHTAEVPSSTALWVCWSFSTWPLLLLLLPLTGFHPFYPKSASAGTSYAAPEILGCTVQSDPSWVG